MKTCLFIFLCTLSFTQAQNYVKGFEFGDNKVPKYVTDENGVAEIKIGVL